MERPDLLGSAVAEVLEQRCTELENHFDAHVLGYSGVIDPAFMPLFVSLVEETKKKDPAKEKLVVVLTTTGGSVETTEKMVEVMRHNYQFVEFVVPELAMSAGTIMVLSGDMIWMDYSSSLGPVDPQVSARQPDGTTALVPALGYLDKIQEMVDRAKANQLTAVDQILLNQIDLATIRVYEQSRDLSIALLKKWLTSYKFRSWTTHSDGSPVSAEERTNRAEEVAEMLLDNKRWHSHGRHLGLATLRNDLRLKIEDFSTNESRKRAIRGYHVAIRENMQKLNVQVGLHSLGWGLV